MTLTAVSLFAGVGGFDLAMQRNGIKTVATVEIDKHARGVLQRHFPDAQHFEDVKNVTGQQLRDAGLVPERGIITGGFPCQDLSVAGKRAGLAGGRSGLFWEIVRLADELQPKYLVLENVPGLLSSNAGRDFGTVLGALVELGYGVAYSILDAQHFGVAQRRRRVFIVGCLGDDGRSPAEILAVPEGLRGDFETGAEAWEEPTETVAVGFRSGSHADYEQGVGTLRASGGDLHGGSETLIVPIQPTLMRAVAHGEYVKSTEAATLHERDHKAGTVDVVVTQATVRRLTPVECERLQGFPDGWTEFGIGDKPQADSHRYKQMGNAVCVNVVEWIMARLVASNQGDTH